MTVADIDDALRALGARLAAGDESADIVIAGVAWMALVLGARGVTKDIDAYSDRLVNRCDGRPRVSPRSADCPPIGSMTR